MLINDAKANLPCWLDLRGNLVTECSGLLDELFEKCQVNFCE